MATIAEIKAFGENATVISSPIAEPLNAPLRFEERLERFGDHYNTNQDSHLYKFLLSLCGDAGAGSLKREKLYPRLQQMLATTYFQDIDKLYGNPIGISRLPIELYIYDPKNEALTQDQWMEVFAKDASYRERCLTWMRAIIEGPTPRGIALAAEAACGIECDVYENYRYIDNAQLTRPASRLIVGDGILTDRLRSPQYEGDGKLNDRSFGVWPATQNLAINGNIATGLSGWSTGAYANHSKVSGITATVDNAQYKFNNSVYYDNLTTNNVSSSSGSSLHLVGSAANQGIHQDIGVTTNGVQYIASAWIKRVGSSGDVKLTLGGASNSSSTITPTTTWTQYSRTWTSNGAATAFSIVQSGATNIDVYVDGLMIEAQPEIRATPFTVTSRKAPELTLPNPETKIANSTGWISMQVRPEWAATDAIGTGKAMLWSWRGPANTSMIRCYFNDTGNVWTIERQNYINPVVQTHTVAATHAKGDSVNVTAAWSSNVIKITIGATELGAGTIISIPITALNGGTFYIGNDAGTNAFMGEILAMAMGNGAVPTQATLNPLMLLNAADPASFPSGTTGYWTADNEFYYSTGSDAPVSFPIVQSSTNSRNEFVILPHVSDIEQREKRAINRLVDKLRPIDTIATVSYGATPRYEVVVNDLDATSTRFNILRYVIGNTTIEWPPPDPAMGYWIDEDYQEAPTFAFLDRQESATYISVKSITASSEHIGQFNAFQKSLFSFLNNKDDFKVFSAQNLYTKNVAPITITTPWMKEQTDQKLIVNNHYPIGYFSDVNLDITVPESSGDFWASDEKLAPATEEIIVDLDVARPFNFIDFNISQKPVDITIEWDDNGVWEPIVIKEGYTANFEVSYLPTVGNPWAYLEYNFDLVASSKIRITFTRRDDYFLLDYNDAQPFSIEVQNLRVIHLIQSIDDFVIDSGTDILGNNFETSSFEYEVYNVIDDNTLENYLFWQSQPNPTRHAVEALYFDIANTENQLTLADLNKLNMDEMDDRSLWQLSDFYTEPSIIDEVYINPITNGPSMHFYYSMDDTPDWENKLWTPIPINYTLRRGYFALPSPTAVKYFKIEFTDLTPLPYQFIEYPSGITSTFRRYPTWVTNYFSDLYPIKPYDENIEVEDVIKVDPLKYGYQAYIDALSTGYQDVREKLFTDTTIEVREFIEDVLAQGQQQRNDTNNAEGRIKFFSPLMWQADLIQLLDPVKAVVRKVQQTRSQLVDDDEWSSEIELPITVPPVQKSMESLQEVAADKQSPVLYFPRFCRHAYQLIQARFVNKVAYHVAIGDVKFLRRDMSVKRDDPIYLETLEDEAHLLNNTLRRIDQYRWGT